MRKIYKYKLFIILLMLSPGIWWPLLKINGALGEMRKIPIYSQSKLNNFFSEDRIKKVDTMRWAHQDRGLEEELYSKVFYNKATIVIDEFFSYLSFFNPRYYFQSGDSSGFSPENVELIPLALFPFWLMGLTKLIKDNKKKIMTLYIFVVFLIFLLGKYELPFVWPIVVFNVYISYTALNEYMFSKKNLIIYSIFLYAIYINFRALIV